MSQQLLRQTGPLAWAALFALLFVLASQALAGQPTAEAALRPTVSAQVFDVNCTSLAAITPPMPSSRIWRPSPCNLPSPRWS